jgi:hypothetical protein
MGRGDFSGNPNQDFNQNYRKPHGLSSYETKHALIEPFANMAGFNSGFLGILNHLIGRNNANCFLLF